MATESNTETVSSDVILARSALFVTLSRMIPVPFLDNFLVRRSIRHMIASIAEAHRLPVDIKTLSPLYSRDHGCLFIVITFPFRFAWKLLTKMFQTIFLALYIYGAIRLIGETILYGHIVERCFLDGKIPAKSGAAPAVGRTFNAARKCRRTFKKVLSRHDLYFMHQAFMSTIMAFLSGIRIDRRLMKILRMKLKDDADANPEDSSITADERSRFQKFIEEITGILARPKMKKFFSGFDARFDSAWDNHP